MNHFAKSMDYLMELIKSCEYYDLTEKQSLELINGKLTDPISRSTYYNYKKKLYQDEKFISLKKSIYKSKLLRGLLLYFDEQDEPDGYDITKLILEKFPDRKDIFDIAEEQQDKINGIHNRVKSNFCNWDNLNNITSNLTRVNHLPVKYTLREEYVRCGKQKNGKCKCNSEKHGPYYYAYRREKLPTQNKSILRKRYLGTIDPRL